MYMHITSFFEERMSTLIGLDALGEMRPSESDRSKCSEVPHVLCSEEPAGGARLVPLAGFSRGEPGERENRESLVGWAGKQMTRTTLEPKMAQALHVY